MRLKVSQQGKILENNPKVRGDWSERREIFALTKAHFPLKGALHLSFCGFPTYF